MIASTSCCRANVETSAWNGRSARASTRIGRHNDRVDPYAVLGVRPGSPESEVAAAYKQLAKQWHPDRGAGEEGERRMAEINVAYEALRDGDPIPEPAPVPRGAGRVRHPLGDELRMALTDGE